MKNLKPKVWGYARVSGPSQEHDEKDGIPRQRQIITAAAKEVGYEIDQWAIDTISGTLGWESRPAFSKMRSQLRSGDIVFVENLDRIARETLQGMIIYADFKSHGFRLFTCRHEEVMNDPQSELLRTIVTAFAQYQKEVIVMRTRAGKANRKAQGHRTDGKLPYGQDPSKPHEKAGVAAIVRLFGEGKTIRAIAAELEAEGHPTRHGGKWAPASILEIYRRNKKAE